MHSSRLVLRFSFVCLVLSTLISPVIAQPPSSAVLGDYLVLGWNDLGMHCMNKNYDTLCVLPPYNNLYAQVILRGERPQLVTQGVTIEYRFPANTYSVDKINFWNYSNALFGVSLQPNIGLTGRGLTGAMDVSGNAFKAEGVPLVPFEDASPTVEQPYQLAEATLRDSSAAVLDQTTFVAPTSVEMHCDQCHGGNNVTADADILRKHDEEEGTNLTGSRPVLCANCHSSNALGKAGQAGLPSLSEAVHGLHAEEVSSISCYACHPGQNTQCLRGAMFIAGKTCTDCHGPISQVASSIRTGRRPWLDEPKCSQCHDANHSENANTLYRFSKGHGNLYCTACHNSPHAELPTVQARDSVQVLRVQNSPSYIRDCTVCHTSVPAGAGPHGNSALPDLALSMTAAPDPVAVGATLSYAMTVVNNGSNIANQIVLVETLPGGVAFGSYTASQGTCTASGQSISCDLGSLSSGAVASVSVTATPSANGVIVATASVTSSASDSNSANDSASVQTTVGTVGRLDLTATWAKLTEKCRSTRTRGTVCTLKGRLIVKNSGPDPADRSILRLLLSTDATIDASDAIIAEISVPGIRGGRQRKVNVKVSLPPGVTGAGRYALAVVNASGSIPESNGGNNLAVFGPLSGGR